MQEKKKSGRLKHVMSARSLDEMQESLPAGLLEPIHLKEVIMPPRRTSAPPWQASCASSRYDAHFPFHLCCSLNLDTDIRRGRTPRSELLAARLKTQTSRSETGKVSMLKTKSAAFLFC